MTHKTDEDEDGSHKKREIHGYQMNRENATGQEEILLQRRPMQHARDELGNSKRDILQHRGACMQSEKQQTVIPTQDAVK